MKDVRELRKSPLEECDRLTHRVSFAARMLAAAEGAATGAGGAATTLIDVPLLFASALRTIIRIGQCYGYPGGEPRDRYFNLGVLTVATAGSVATPGAAGSVERPRGAAGRRNPGRHDPLGAAVLHIPA